MQNDEIDVFFNLHAKANFRFSFIEFLWYNTNRHGESEVISMDLSAFKAFNFQEGVPYLSITDNGVTFNKAVTLKMGKPEYTVFLIDRVGKRVVLKACDENTPNAVKFFNKDRNNPILSVRWNSRDLLNTLSQLMGWDLSKTGYRIPGTFYQADDLVLFDLNERIIIK